MKREAIWLLLLGSIFLLLIAKMHGQQVSGPSDKWCVGADVHVPLDVPCPAEYYDWSKHSDQENLKMICSVYPGLKGCPGVAVDVSKIRQLAEKRIRSADQRLREFDKYSHPAYSNNDLYI